MKRLSANPYLSLEERKSLLKKNDFRALVGVLYYWLIIIGAFALVYFFPNPLTILLSLFLLGGQQLACSILMHDASHKSVFSSKRLNDFVGNWFGAYPVMHHVQDYRPYHLKHHVNTGTEEDPDLLLTRGYPTSRKSMMRKFFRDLSGQTGIKAYVGIFAMHLGYMEYNLGGKAVWVSQKDRSWTEFFNVFFRKLSGPILAQVIIFGLLWAFASPWMYLLWIGALLTTFQFSLRVRSMAEHSMTDQSDPIRNTRTTYANFFERLLFAPYNVNYHVEHHMLMTVPFYNLPRMHKLLKERGFYEEGTLEENYLNVLKLAVQE
ncbi:MAG: fatty acid desaturase family protein [Bacteroidota bacterium]